MGAGEWQFRRLTPNWAGVATVRQPLPHNGADAATTPPNLRRGRRDEKLACFSMNTLSPHFGVGLAVLALVFSPRAQADSGTSPDFKEVQSVLLEHLAGATESQMNQVAVKGLLHELQGRVRLIMAEEALDTNNATLLVLSGRQFDGGVGYVRVKDVEAGLDGAISSVVGRLMASNKLVGLVLDLRYAKGGDYAAAASAVDLFLAHEVPLMNAGQGLVSSKEKENALKLPVVALLNRETTGAAEALGAMLRKSGVGLLIGQSTAGRAGITKDYQLSTGQILRVMTAPIQLGDAKAISPDGVKPDVEVAVDAEAEQKYYDDPYVRLNGNSEIRAGSDGEGESSRVRVTEADLVREKRGDGDLEQLAGARVKAEERAPKVTDPALARAIDLLKGLAVVRQWKF